MNAHRGIIEDLIKGHLFSVGKTRAKKLSLIMGDLDLYERQLKKETLGGFLSLYREQKAAALRASKAKQIAQNEELRANQEIMEQIAEHASHTLSRGLCQMGMAEEVKRIDKTLRERILGEHHV